jgi:hypothetical protein
MTRVIPLLFAATLSFVFVFCMACNPPVTPHGDASVCAQVCDHLAAVQCALPASASCEATCVHAPIDLRPDCLLDATSAAGVEACGTVHCRSGGGVRDGPSG